MACNRLDNRWTKQYMDKSFAQYRFSNHPATRVHLQEIVQVMEMGESDHCTFNNNLSTVGFTNITVLWGERRSGSAINPLILSWSVNGTNWTAVSYTPPTTTSTWQLVNGGNRIVLPGAEGAANLRFRFTTTNETTATVYRIDDFTIQGTPVPTCPTITALVNLKTDITCYATSDGSITVSASGGVAPYTFSKDNGAPYVTGDNATSHTFSGLLANVVYKIRVKDANGCESPVIP